MRTRAIYLLCAIATAGSADAADSLLLTGTEQSPLGDYAYVGVLTPLGRGSLGNGWVMRHWLDRVTYDYDTGNAKVAAQSYGYSPAVGYQQPVGVSRVGIYGAVRIGHTSLSPDDPANVDRGTRARFSVQADAFTPIGTRVENQLIVQAEIGNGGYYARDRLQMRCLQHYAVGPEIVLKGSREYSAMQAGLAFGGISLGKRTALLLRAGAVHQRDRSSEMYAGAEVTLNF